MAHILSRSTKEIKEYQIGDTFLFRGKILKVVKITRRSWYSEHDNCNRCIFGKSKKPFVSCKKRFKCQKNDRKDKNDVIYKHIGKYYRRLKKKKILTDF